MTRVGAVHAITGAALGALSALLVTNTARSQAAAPLLPPPPAESAAPPPAPPPPAAPPPAAPPPAAPPPAAPPPAAPPPAATVAPSAPAPPAPASTASFPPPCPSNQVAADGTCLVSPAIPSTPPPPPLPQPAPMAVVVNPAPVPAQDAGPPPKGGPNTGLLAGGLALFAVGYGATIGVNFGVCGSGATWRGCDSKGLSFVPVVGPFIFAGIEKTEASYRVLAVTLGLTQAAGAVMFGLSFAGSGGDRSAKTAYVLPSVSRDGAGATVVGRF